MLEDLNDRVFNLELRLKNVEARLRISQEDRPKFGSVHQGTKTKEVISQEWKSLMNNSKFHTMTKEEKKEWYDANEALMLESKSLSSSDWEWVLQNVSQFREIIESVTRKFNEVKP